MAIRFTLTDYVSQALAYAVYGKLEDISFAMAGTSRLLKQAVVDRYLFILLFCDIRR